MSKRAPSDRQMERVERMLECYIEANKPGNRKRRQQEDPFYQKLQRLRELQKEMEEEKRNQSDNPDEGPKR